MSEAFPSVLRTHAESMDSEGWYTVANALARAADEIEGHPTMTPTPAVSAKEKAREMKAVLGDDYQKPGQDHPTFGITITDAWLNIRGEPRPHGNMIEVYRTKALRDRVLYLLQTYGLEDRPAALSTEGEAEPVAWRRREAMDNETAGWELYLDPVESGEPLYAHPPSAPAGVKDAADAIASNLLRDGCTYADRKAAADYIRSSLQPDTQTSSPTYVVNCCNCGRVIDTREKDEGGDGWGHELSDDRWVCSPECFDAVTEPDTQAAAASAPAQAEALAKADEQTDRYHKRPFTNFAGRDEKRRKQIVRLPMDVLLAIIRERLEYLRHGSDLDAVTQNAACEIERAMGVFPNLDAALSSAPAQEGRADPCMWDQDKPCTCGGADCEQVDFGKGRADG